MLEDRKCSAGASGFARCVYAYNRFDKQATDQTCVVAVKEGHPALCASLRRLTAVP